MFTLLIENYKDEDHFSTDMDEKVDGLVAFAYIGTTAMQQTAPMGSRSGSSSSQISGEVQPPCVDLTGGLLERGRKTPDLDKTIEMTDETPTAMDSSEVEVARVWEERPVSEASASSKKKKKSKLTRKAR